MAFPWRIYGGDLNYLHPTYIHWDDTPSILGLNLTSGRLMVGIIGLEILGKKTLKLLAPVRIPHLKYIRFAKESCLVPF